MNRAGNIPSSVSSWANSKADFRKIRLDGVTKMDRAEFSDGWMRFLFARRFGEELPLPPPCVHNNCRTAQDPGNSNQMAPIGDSRSGCPLAVAGWPLRKGTECQAGLHSKKKTYFGMPVTRQGGPSRVKEGRPRQHEDALGQSRRSSRRQFCIQNATITSEAKAEGQHVSRAPSVGCGIFFYLYGGHRLRKAAFCCFDDKAFQESP